MPRARIAHRAGGCAGSNCRRRATPGCRTAAARRRCGKTPASGSGSFAPAISRSRSGSKTERPTRPCRECRAGYRRRAPPAARRSPRSGQSRSGSNASTVSPPSAAARQPGARARKCSAKKRAVWIFAARNRASPSPALMLSVGGQCLARHQPAGSDDPENFEIGCGPGSRPVLCRHDQIGGGGPQRLQAAPQLFADPREMREIGDGGDRARRSSSRYRQRARPRPYPGRGAACGRRGRRPGCRWCPS